MEEEGWREWGGGRGVEGEGGRRGWREGAFLKSASALAN